MGTPLLRVLQTPSTSVTAKGDRPGDLPDQLGLGWFITPATGERSASINKDGDLDGFSSYIAFLPSANPGTVPSQAGAFVLVNGMGITDDQTKGGKQIVRAVVEEILKYMQGKAPLAGKSPRSV